MMLPEMLTNSEDCYLKIVTTVKCDSIYDEKESGITLQTIFIFISLVNNNSLGDC